MTEQLKRCIPQVHSLTQEYICNTLHEGDNDDDDDNNNNNNNNLFIYLINLIY